MESDCGKQMGKAIQAVLEMQNDCIRLFRDLDKAFPKCKSILGNVVALNLGNSISRSQYLAEGLIRLYSHSGKQNQVLGINICFFDGTRLEEPVFVAANTRYRTGSPDAREKLEMGWDPWYAFLEWSPGREYRQAVTLQNPPKRASVEQVTVAAAPLYSITSLESALGIIELVGHP